MDGNRIRESADTADLDVHDSTRSEFQRSFGVARTANRLVQANRGLELLLKTCMEVEVITPQGLLDHQQLETVERLQVLQIVERISRVGVAAQ